MKTLAMCEDCGLAKFFGKRTAPLPRAEVTFGVVVSTLVTVIATALWTGSLADNRWQWVFSWIAVGFTFLWIGVVLPWLWKYLQRNVRPLYRWCSVDPRTEQLHAHLDPSGRGFEFRITTSGWIGRNLFFFGGEQQKDAWAISRSGPGYALVGRPWGFKKFTRVRIYSGDLAALIQLAERGPFDLTLRELLAREEGLVSLYGFAIALREVIQDPAYARSPYAKFIGDLLERSWPYPERLAADGPHFERVLESWRTELRSQAEDVLPKRKVAVVPTS